MDSYFKATIKYYAYNEVRLIEKTTDDFSDFIQTIRNIQSTSMLTMESVEISVYGEERGILKFNHKFNHKY